MSVNKEGSTALHLASSAGSLSCIQVCLLLLDCDTLCFVVPYLQCFLSCVLQELLEAEAGRKEMLSLEDRWGRTPLLLATSNGNTEVLSSMRTLMIL